MNVFIILYMIFLYYILKSKKIDNWFVFLSEFLLITIIIYKLIPEYYLWFTVDLLFIFWLSDLVRGNNNKIVNICIITWLIGSSLFVFKLLGINTPYTIILAFTGLFIKILTPFCVRLKDMALGLLILTGPVFRLSSDYLNFTISIPFYILIIYGLVLIPLIILFLRVYSHNPKYFIKLFVLFYVSILFCYLFQEGFNNYNIIFITVLLLVNIVVYSTDDKLLPLALLYLICLPPSPGFFLFKDLLTIHVENSGLIYVLLIITIISSLFSSMIIYKEKEKSDKINYKNLLYVIPVICLVIAYNYLGK